MMKINNSSIHNNPLESYHSTNKLEKFKEAQGKIADINNVARDTPDTIVLSDQAKKLLEDAEIVKDVSRKLEAAANSEGSPYDELTKCLEIASRIVTSNKVGEKQ